MAGILKPTKRTISSIKYKLMQPALTSHFQCQFVIPEKVRDQLKFNNLIAGSDLDDTLTISCSEASLPGSSLMTHELNNDFTGVTQKHVHRRMYDDRASFTFYVDQKYTQIRVFEVWMRYIAGEQISLGEDTTIAYRMQFPQYYKTSLYVTKFERDINQGTFIPYTFVNAFPLQIDSMPVSYESSQLLKCIVSFSYDRYFLGNPGSTKTGSAGAEPGQQSGFGVPVNSPLNAQQIAASYNTNLNFNISPNQFNLQAPEPGATGSGGITQADIFNVTQAEQNLIRSNPNSAFNIY
jgi:hypothetical protein